MSMGVTLDGVVADRRVVHRELSFLHLRVLAIISSSQRDLCEIGAERHCPPDDDCVAIGRFLQVRIKLSDLDTLCGTRYEK